MLYVLGSILFVAASIVAVAVIMTQVRQYRQIAMVALRGLSMDGWSGPKLAKVQVSSECLAQRFTLQPAVQLLKPQAVV